MSHVKMRQFTSKVRHAFFCVIDENCANFAINKKNKKHETNLVSYRFSCILYNNEYNNIQRQRTC